MDETDKIKRAFGCLVFDVMKNIEKSRSLDEVVTLLTFSMKTGSEEFASHCSSYGEVFRKISNLISFFDYDLLKLLIHKMGSSSVKRKLKKYKQKFQQFTKRCVCEVPKGAFGDANKSEKVFVIKCDKSIETMTLEELHKLQYKMNKILGHKLLRLLDIKDGCVELAIRCLECHMHNLSISEKQQKDLKKLGVLSIRYGDIYVICYDWIGHKNYRKST